MDDAREYIQKGDDCAKQNQWEKAIEFYTKARTLDPGNTDIFYKLTLANRSKEQYNLIRNGDEALLAGIFESAIESYLKSLHINPKNAEVYYKLSVAYNKKAIRDKDKTFFVLSEEQARKSISLNPKKIEYHDNLMAVFMYTGRLEELVHEYKGKSNADPANEIYKSMTRKILTISITSVPEISKMPEQKGCAHFAVNLVLLGGVLIGLFSVFSPHYKVTMGMTRVTGIISVTMILAYFVFILASRAIK